MKRSQEVKLVRTRRRDDETLRLLSSPLFPSFPFLPPLRLHLAFDSSDATQAMPSTGVNPAALGKLPIALTLPNELWIEILLQLDYANLKKACRICKGLQGFIKVCARL